MVPTLFATSQASSGLLGALGIDWRTLLLYAVAFLIVAWLMEKFIYPVLIKALDDKKNELIAADRLKQAAEHELAAARDSAMTIIVQAHQAAREAQTAAHAQATELMKVAHTQAAKRSARLLAEGRREIEADAQAARQQLKKDTALLATEAAEQLLRQKLTPDQDAELIIGALGAKN